MKKGLLTCIAILLLISLILVGCSTSGTTTPAPATQGTKPAPIATSTAPAASTAPTTATTATAKPTVASSVPVSKIGGTLKAGFGASSQAFGYPPLIAYGARTAACPAIEHLLDFEVTGRPYPRLARDFKIGEDGKTFTIFLREGVKFHDGTDCDAEAIKWNMEQFPIAKVPMLTSVESITVVDKWTVRLNLKNFSNAIIYDLVLSGGMPISPTSAKQNGIEWTYTHPVGTGPFKFESFKRDVSLKYVRNENYWDKGKPYLDALEFHYIADTVTREMALKSGEIGVLMDYDLRSHASLKAAGLTMKKAPMGIYALYPDSKNSDSPFAKKQVREAVEYAIDKQAIVDALGYGIWESVTQVVHKSRMGYCPDIQGRPYDPAKAKFLLGEAGYPNGFKTKIIAQNTEGQDLMVAMKNYLAAVGIDASIELLDIGKWNEYYYKGWNNALMWYFTPSEPRSFDAVNRQFAPDSNYAVSILKSASIGELLTKGDRESDTNKLAANVQGVVRILSQEALAIPMFMRYHVAAESPKITDTGVYDESRTFKTYQAWGDAYFIK